MSPEQRQQLAALDKPGLTIGAKDVRWATVMGFQRKRLLRVVPLTLHVARIELTDAGRAALREGQADG